MVSKFVAQKMQEAKGRLTKRWTPLRHHAVQRAWCLSDTRFNVIHAGRRSGKTELAKRRLVRAAISFCEHPDGWFVAAAPTHSQARRIFWADLKKLVPGHLRRGRPSESELVIPLFNGARIQVLGMDAPERIEGPPLDYYSGDEYGNSKKDLWDEHVRPALSTPGRLGRADLFGVPEGRNHYYDLSEYARHDETGQWGNWHWFSEDILDAEETEAAKRDLDSLTYDQEYRGQFVSFEGRVYYDFFEETHANKRIKYFDGLDLILCFDFNAEPGVAVVCQEQEYVGDRKDVSQFFTAIIGEVHIPRNSNTVRVCKKLLEDWGKHPGKVRIYGDATGGAKGSASVQGSDWDLVKSCFKGKWPGGTVYGVQRSNPRERARVNAVNTRIKNANGMISLLVDRKAAPHTSKDLMGTSLVKGGAFEIEKKDNPKLTHLSDALGYYLAQKFPAAGRAAEMTHMG